MSLAEELMADFDDDEEVDDLDDELEIKEEEIEEAVEAPAQQEYSNVHEVAKLSLSEEYLELMATLVRELDRTDEVKVTAPLEADPQYKLIVRLSHLSSSIDNEIYVIHKFVRDKYEKRFPELESLIPNPLEFIAAVKLLGNDINTLAKNKDLLGAVIAPSTAFVVAVTASTSQGKPLDQDTLNAVMEACDLAETLHNKRISMHRLVEMRMSLIAPNLVQLLGAAVTAALVSQAGGLAPLSRMPACNVQVLGKQKKNLVGFSSAMQNNHCGFVYYHPIVQQLPPDLKMKAMKIVAAKATLAARVDSLHEAPDGSVGANLLEQVQKKFEKLVEPPSVKNAKALPKPLDKSSKKRGGRRVRKMKERLGMTEMRKKNNRMNFGELGEDVMQDNLGYHRGQLKTSGTPSGRIRAGVVNQATKVRMSQKQQRIMEKQRQQGGITSIKSRASGTASSISFTPVQGLEIVNPTAIEKTPSASTTYFSSSATFMKVGTPKPE